MREKKKDDKQRVYYQRARVSFYYPIPIRAGCCIACKRCKSRGEIKTTQLHHTVYKYETKTVRKNPVLALENTLELCYGCHPMADGFRGLLLSNPRGGLRSINRIIQVAKLLPKEQQRHFSKLCRTWIKNK